MTFQGVAQLRERSAATPPAGLTCRAETRGHSSPEGGEGDSRPFCATRLSVMRLLLLLVASLAAACRPCPVEVPQVGPDGGAAPCVTSADCLRPSATLLCATTEDRLRDCVDCVGRRCVRFIPEACP